MWRLGSPMQLSHDLNDDEHPIGVPPITSPVEYLIDEFGAFLLDASEDYLTGEL